MRQAGLEPATQARQLPQANALDLAVAGIGSKRHTSTYVFMCHLYIFHMVHRTKEQCMWWKLDAITSFVCYVVNIYRPI
jgi:hypothetical protein